MKLFPSIQINVEIVVLKWIGFVESYSIISWIVAVAVKICVEVFSLYVVSNLNYILFGRLIICLGLMMHFLRL